MGLKIFNTLSGKKEDFIPLRPGKVGMYVCGVTVYDSCHLGHARAAIIFDVIYRYLKSKGYEVAYVRNYTDIDDKIIDRARREGISWKDIAQRYILEFEEDMTALVVEKPSFEPKATEHIPEIIEMINALMEKGYAYEVEGDVFYSVQEFQGYGKLSNKNLEELMSGVRIEINPKKKDSLDFALWKSSQRDEPWWDSPWGKGRPGWHMECSAMSKKYLGDSFDIHGGGKDLIFPHHENEIAQSEALTDKPFVKYWVHNGFVNVNGQKMSKSLGNILLIKELLKRYHPEVLRHFLISHHYRSPIDFTTTAMQEAEISLERVYETLAEIDNLIHPNPPLTKGGIGGFSEEKIQDLTNSFTEAMDDDFNTAKALGEMQKLVKELNRFLHPSPPGGRVRACPERSEGEGADKSILTLGKRKLVEMGKVFGIFQLDPKEFLEEQKFRRLEEKGLRLEEILALIRERDLARQRKDWVTADGIRKRLNEMDVLLEDGKEGTSWKVKT